MWNRVRVSGLDMTQAQGSISLRLRWSTVSVLLGLGTLVNIQANLEAHVSKTAVATGGGVRYLFFRRSLWMKMHNVKLTQLRELIEGRYCSTSKVP